MHYKIYIDKLWFVDFVMNTYLLLLVRQTFGFRSRLFKVFISAALSGVVFVVLLLLPGLPLWLKILFQALPGNFLLLQAAFSFRTKETAVRSYACMNGYALLLGGMLFALSGYPAGKKLGTSAFGVLFCGGGTALLAGVYLHDKKKRAKSRGLYQVTLDFYGKSLVCRGFLDSGNSLREPYASRPVAVLEKAAAEGFLERVPDEKHFLIPFHSIGKQHGLLSAVELPAMEVDGKGRREVFEKVVVALADGKLSARGGYQMILHPQFIRQED